MFAKANDGNPERQENIVIDIRKIGLELALLVKDPWEVMFTTDSPNGGS